MNRICTWTQQDVDDMLEAALAVANERIAELEDELEDVRRDADRDQEQLGYLRDLEASVNGLFDAMGVPVDETLTASDTIDYAVEHLRNAGKFLETKP